MNEFDFHDEMIQIEMLFQSHMISYGYKEYSLETFADRGYFQEWKANEGCRDTDEMRASLNLDGILRSDAPSNGEVLTYLQYVLNIAELCRRSFNAAEDEGYDFEIRNYTELLSRIRALLRELRYDVKYVAEKDFLYIVPHDTAAEAASADDQDPVSGAITEYRALPAGADLNSKRQLLQELGSRIESYPDNLKEDHAKLYSHIEFMLNNVNIRYDNTDGDDEIDRVSQMDAAELESWYDETFQLLLMRILEHQNDERMDRIDHLAAECGVGISSVTEDEIAEILSDFHEEEERIRAIEKEETASAEDEGSPERPDRRRPEREKRRNAEETAAAKTRDIEAGDHSSAMKVLLSILIAVLVFIIFVVIYSMV